MRALIQRVSEASVTVDGTVIGEIGPGILALVCAMEGDGDEAPARLAAKIAKLRIFRDDDGRMNRSVQDVGGSVLVVSQFTLAGDTSRGHRPGFSSAAAPDIAERLYEASAQALRDQGLTVATGQFGADMKVRLLNDGPVTLWLEV